MSLTPLHNTSSNYDHQTTFAIICHDDSTRHVIWSSTCTYLLTIFKIVNMCKCKWVLGRLEMACYIYWQTCIFHMIYHIYWQICICNEAYLIYGAQINCNVQLVYGVCAHYRGLCLKPVLAWWPCLNQYSCLINNCWSIRIISQVTDIVWVIAK